MDDEDVLVPPEVHDGLEHLRESGDLDPEDRETAKRSASEAGYEHTADWIEQAGEDVYDKAARGRFSAQMRD